MKRLLPFFLLFILFLILIYEASVDTPTYDEPANMAASFDYVYGNDFRIYPDNPPAVKLLAGLSLFPIKNRINFPQSLETYSDPAKYDLYAFGRDFLYNSGNDAGLIIFLARLPNILFTLALGVVLYLFAKSLYGEKAGLFGLFLYTLDPNIRGHGHILAFDIPLAFFIMLVLYLTYRWISHSGKRGTSASRIQGGSWTSQDDGFETSSHLSISLVFALGFLTKFTFIFFAAIYFGGLIIYIFTARLKNTPGVLRSDSPGVKRSIILFISVAVISFLSLWLFGILTNYNKKTLDYDKVSIIASASQQLGGDFKWNLFKALPLPYHYKLGMMMMYTHDLVSQPAYLLGEVHAKNDWFLYFPISFLLKTPIPTLILIGLTIYFLIIKSLKTTPGAARKDSPGVEKSAMRIYLINYFPFLFGFAFMFFMMLFSHINNVYRYLFPSLALFILGSSQIVNYKSFTLHASRFTLFFILNSLFLILTSVLSFPLDLSYTNEFTGLPSQGYKYLSDSEVDWGQDLGRLGKWLEDNQLDEQTITLSYLGTAEPAFYGIKYRPLQFDDLGSLSGTVAISVGNLTLGDWQWRSQPDYKLGTLTAPLDFLRATKPYAVIGKSIFVYKFQS